MEKSMKIKPEKVKSIDTFMQIVTFLPFEDVKSLCMSNSQYRQYCTSDRYRSHWKLLIDNAFSDVDDYENKLRKISNDLMYDDVKYNYLVYTQLVKTLDPVTQLIIYYRQNDPLFNSPKYDNTQRALAMLLLKNYNEMEKFLDGKISFDKNTPPRSMIRIFATAGYLPGVKGLYNKYKDNKITFYMYPFVDAILNDRMDVIKYYLSEEPEMVNTVMNTVLKHGNLDILKLIIDNSNINIDDLDIRMAILSGNTDMVKYLLENGKYYNHTRNILSVVALQRNLEMLKLLLSYDDFLDEEEIKTALHMSRRRKFDEISEYLNTILITK